MKSKTLLLIVMTLFIISVNAQKKEKPITGYAITAVEKGGRNWKEVRLVDITTGQELKSVYQSSQETEALNARTGKPVVKKEISGNGVGNGNATTLVLATPTTPQPEKKKVVNLDDELNKVNGNVNSTVRIKTVYVSTQKIQVDKPFATNSAAMAYDKKHERLYYTPMGINQLRYIDLKSNKIYFFEDEAFGIVKGFGDAANQITRMVIASDGNGYALTNDGNHLIRFTTGKKPTITDLGPLSDDGKNAASVHNPGGFGGDMIADASENLYLITANRNVYKFPVATKVASYVGTIKGLPRGFSTNGAMVDEGSKVIVASSESTTGYYRFDLNTMQAELISGEASVFNASDLANGNLAFDKKQKEQKPEEPTATAEEPKKTITEEDNARTAKPGLSFENSISVYPNPVTNGNIKVSFNDLPAGKYQVQLLDLSGKLINSQEVNISSKMQVESLNLPEVAKGNYLIKIVNEPNKVSVTNKLVVQ